MKCKDYWDRVQLLRNSNRLEVPQGQVLLSRRTWRLKAAGLQGELTCGNSFHPDLPPGYGFRVEISAFSIHVFEGFDLWFRVSGILVTGSGIRVSGFGSGAEGEFEISGSKTGFGKPKN